MATSRPVAMLLLPGKTPSGTEIRGHLRRLVRRIRQHWPATRITIRGDGHYGRPEVMEWCDEKGIDFIFGLPATPCSTGWSMRPPTTFALAARSTRSPAGGALPRRATRRNHPGTPTTATDRRSIPPLLKLKMPLAVLQQALSRATAAYRRKP
jgi:hypothetical protein